MSQIVNLNTICRNNYSYSFVFRKKKHQNNKTEVQFSEMTIICKCCRRHTIEDNKENHFYECKKG